MVGVGVRADEQAHVGQAQADLLQRPHEMLEGAGFVHPTVDEDDAVARSERPGVAVRDTRIGERQAQAPHAGKHPLAAAHLLLARRLGHRRPDDRLAPR